MSKFSRFSLEGSVLCRPCRDAPWRVRWSHVPKRHGASLQAKTRGLGHISLSDWLTNRNFYISLQTKTVRNRHELTKHSILSVLFVAVIHIVCFAANCCRDISCILSCNHDPECAKRSKHRIFKDRHPAPERQYHRKLCNIKRFQTVGGN